MIQDIVSRSKNNVGQDGEQIMPIAFDNLEGNTGVRCRVREEMGGSKHSLLF